MARLPSEGMLELTTELTLPSHQVCLGGCRPISLLCCALLGRMWAMQGRQSILRGIVHLPFPFVFKPMRV